MNETTQTENTFDDNTETQAAETTTQPARAAFSFTKLKHVTLPLFKWTKNKEQYYKIVGTIYQGEPIKGDDKKEPAFLMHVIDLETGETGQVILGTVLRETLQKSYPDETYVNKCFAITEVRPIGKDYNTYTITEIEVNETPTTPAFNSDAAAESSLKNGKKK